MTRDEVLNEVIDAVQALVLPGGSRAEVFRTIAALKSRPPEKSPEVEAPKDTGTAFGEIYEVLDTIKAHLGRGRRAEAERDGLRLQVGELKLALEAARQEVSRLKWEAADAPMQGEHAGDPADCAACAEGYPPPPGEPKK